MRRRSERKKSTDSPAASSRRSNRRSKKSPDAVEKNAEPLNESLTEIEEEDESPPKRTARVSSTESTPSRKASGRSSVRNRTRGESSITSTRRQRHSSQIDEVIQDTIPEEENGSALSTEETEKNVEIAKNANKTSDSKKIVDVDVPAKPILAEEKLENIIEDANKDNDVNDDDGGHTPPPKPEVVVGRYEKDSPKDKAPDAHGKDQQILEENDSKILQQQKVKELNLRQESDDDKNVSNLTNENQEDISMVDEQKDVGSSGKSSKPTKAELNDEEDGQSKEDEVHVQNEEGQFPPQKERKSENKVTTSHGHNENGQIDAKENEESSENKRDVAKSVDDEKSSENSKSTRKRRWISKKNVEQKTPIIMAISSDSLKNLIDDEVKPVPLSDVRLESSSEVEEVASEREEGEEVSSQSSGQDHEHARERERERDRGRERERERERRRSPIDNMEKLKNKRRDSSNESGGAADRGGNSSANTKTASNKTVKNNNNATAGPPPLPSTPSPPRNQASCVLFITNLVRPFTVLQLKGLLARTGKIVEDGFWIDRIKSKCYVEYETEDEAIETRHALHGVRWPVSNPKCLNVDFGKKSDMLIAIESTKDSAPRLDNINKEKDYVVGPIGWNRDQIELDEKKRPVREWDVGKKDAGLEREKLRELEKARRNSKDRERDHERERERDRGRERDRDRDRDADRNERDRGANKRTKGKETRSISLSPSRKIRKKENEPPIRLLDDLFRKTKITPCIYWLPLTPEQIAEKEAFRQKRIAEHKERIRLRELERQKEREKERNRDSDRDKERERDREREREREREKDRDRRSSRDRDRRRTRSRDRRR